MVPSTADLYIVAPKEHCPSSSSEDLDTSFTLPSDLAEGARLWAVNIAQYVELGDKRRQTRLAKILTAFACNPLASIPYNTQNGIGLDSTYDFFKNPHFDHEDLVTGFGVATAIHISNAGLLKIYVVQDSTSYNFTNLKKTTGLGPISDCPNTRGLHAHNTIAVDEQGIMRGVMHIKFWARSDVKIDEKKDDRPFEKRESYKWIEGLEGTRKAFGILPKEKRPKLIHVMDREGDIHEVLQDIADKRESAIIRCVQNRKIGGELQWAHQAVHAAKCLGTYDLDVKASKEHKAHKATIEVRATTVTLTPNQTTYPNRKPLTVNLVEAWEPNPPEGSKPICWRLWTLEPASTFEEALEVIRGYRMRWRVEEVHLATKSGCQVEKLELETAERLFRAISLYTAVAIRIVNLRDLCKHNPEGPCTTVLCDEEWRVLQAQVTQKPVAVDAKAPTIRQATLWLGKLGGHLGRKGDGLPGVRTLWEGLRTLHILIKGSRIERAGLVERSRKPSSGQTIANQQAPPSS